MSPFLAIVPARGGSKGVKRKNLRLLAGKPLLQYTVDALSQVEEIDRIVVSTEDPEIAGYARLRGYEVLDRPVELASDETTVAEVAQHVVEALDWHGDVGVFQPTSPLLSAETISRAIEDWRSSGKDSLVSVTPADHLTWHYNHGRWNELQHRVNRQVRDQNVQVENGAIQLCKRHVLSLYDPPRTIDDRPVLFSIKRPEAIDVDTHADLESARLELDRKRIVFRVAVGSEVGSGHLYRCLRLAEELSHHDVRFDVDDYDDAMDWANRMLVDARGWIQADALGGEPDLVIFDWLDTSAESVLREKARGAKVVTLEDMGEGAQYADLVINELYDGDNGHNVVTGPKWTVLRPEFACLPPKVIRTEPERVLITFGGTDPAGLTSRLIGALAPWLDMKVRAIAGPGSPVSPARLGSYQIVRDVESMAYEMMQADLVITSNGRTAHEAAATGTPTITISANDRETRHVHCPGILDLGLHAVLGDDQIARAVANVLNDYDLRAEMSRTSRAAIDGRGVDRIVHRIEGLLQGL